MPNTTCETETSFINGANEEGGIQLPCCNRTSGVQGSVHSEAGDPVCAQHEPQNPHEHRFLHGAACHGCLLIAETSCEQQNDFLDRALAVPTVEGRSCEFFKGILKNEPAPFLTSTV
jgi:hypothetical protein